MKKKKNAIPELTVKNIRSTLKKSAKGADELLKKLNEAHLRGYSRSMSLRLD